MKLKKISWRNFKSYSNRMVEFSLDKPSSLNLIVGENGAGKSAIAQCITYLLYGKIDGTTAADIPNRINKNFYGKLELEHGGHNIVVERGLAPKMFKVTVDGKEIDTAGKLNVQSMLEDNYYKLPYSVFKNLIILDINGFKSLVDLNPSDKRSIIDKILGFTIINEMSAVVKEEFKVIQNDASQLDVELRSIAKSIDDTIAKMNEVHEQYDENEVNALNEEVEKLKTNILDNRNTLKKLRDAKDKVTSVAANAKGEIRLLNNKISDIDKRVKLIDGGYCPTCGTKLDGAEFITERENLLEDKQLLEKNINVINESQKEYSDKSDAIDKKYAEYQHKIDGINAKLLELNSTIQYKKSLNKENNNSFQELIESFKEKQETLKAQKKILDGQIGFFNILTHTFSESGVKQYIGQRTAPELNSIIAQKLDMMQMPYSIEFDSKFDCKIKNYGYDVNYNSLSSGERKRVDFACIVSFITFLERQYPDINLLFLDEVFANVDINGIATLIDILKDVTADLGLNIFLIHHAQVDSGAFDNVIEIKKENGFSVINTL